MGIPKRISPIETKLILMGRYEHLYGIRDHAQDDADNPMPLLAINRHDDVASHNPLYERMDDFIHFKVAKHMGMSFNEFIRLPRDYCEKIFDICQKHCKIEDQLAENTMSNIESQFGKT